jgi:hypothetical protein
MRVTIDISAQDMRRIQKATGERKKSAAIKQALSAYLRSRRKAKLIERALGGKTDFSLSNEQLEELVC